VIVEAFCSSEVVRIVTVDVETIVVEVAGTTYQINQIKSKYSNEAENFAGHEGSNDR